MRSEVAKANLTARPASLFPQTLLPALHTRPRGHTTSFSSLLSFPTHCKVASSARLEPFHSFLEEASASPAACSAIHSFLWVLLPAVSRTLVRSLAHPVCSVLRHRQDLPAIEIFPESRPPRSHKVSSRSTVDTSLVTPLTGLVLPQTTFHEQPSTSTRDRFWFLHSFSSSHTPFRPLGRRL